MNNCDKLLTLLGQATTLSAEHTPIFSIPYPDARFRGFQGGCSDGERYYYQVLMHYEHADRTQDYSCIAKVDLRTKTVVKYSGVLRMGHANDITYHRGTHRLIVVNNTPTPNRLTFVDPDTLEITGTKEIAFPIYALEYNEKRDTYLCGLSGTREFRFLDANFRPTEDRVYRTSPLTDRYTKQGICADDHLLYFILWDGKHKDLPDFQNLIALYDWQGDFKGTLHFNVGVQEPESLSVVNGEILAVCGKGEPVLYRFDPA